MFYRPTMDVFSLPPTPFKLHRDSPLAADLKSAISVHLPLLLGPLFADNVLTEYITVLVCNGKTQYQAREDLDAFLGERSEAFVSWLWDLLLKNEQHCTVATTLKDKGDIMTCPEDVERKGHALGVKSEKAEDAATTIQMLNHQKTRNDILPKVFISSPKRDHLSRATSPAPDCPRNTQVSGSLYCDKVTVSVWDRLSRPNKTALVEPHVDNVRKYGEVQSDKFSPFLSKSIRSRLRRGEVIHQGNRYQGRASKHYLTSNFDNNSSGNYFVNDMQRKRNFVQVSQSDLRLGGRRCGDNFNNNQWRADKRLKFAAETPRDLLSTVEDVKLRLRQMEREISLLRSRNVETGEIRKNKASMNYGKSSCCAEKLSGEDLESRTVLVSNVHYAAKRDALFAYFANCGRVINVVLLSDLSCFAPDSFVRSAYVTFANLESVDKAVSLSGTLFYSRSIKVFKCNHNDFLPVASTSPAVSYTGRSVQQSASYHGTHLLCKREFSPSPVASEKSAPLVAKEEVAELTASGPEQPSLSLSPQKDSAGNSSMLNADSIMEKTDERAELSVSGDQLPSSDLPTTELAGCTDIHSAEKVNMEVEVSASTDEQSFSFSPLKEYVAEETNMEVQVKVSGCGDEQLSLIPSPLKDIADYSNMHNTESTVEESNMEAEVTASGDEERVLVSAVEDCSGDSNMHKIESILEKTNMEAEVTASGDEERVLVSAVEDCSGDSNVHKIESILEKSNMEAEVAASGDEESVLVSAVEDCSGDSNMHNTESTVEESNMEAEVTASGDEEPVLVSAVEDCSGDSNMHKIESILEKTNMEAEVKACEDEQLVWVSVVEDGSGDSNMHKIEFILEKTSMEAEVKAREDEQLVLVSVVEDGSGDSSMHNTEFILEKTNMEEVKDCEDEVPDLVSAVEDGSEVSNIHNPESSSAKQTGNLISCVALPP